MRELLPRRNFECRDQQHDAEQARDHQRRRDGGEAQADPSATKPVRIEPAAAPRMLAR